MDWIVEHLGELATVPATVIGLIVVMRIWPTIDKVIDAIIGKKKQKQPTNGKHHSAEETTAITVCNLHADLSDSVKELTIAVTAHSKKVEEICKQQQHSTERLHDRIDDLFKLQRSKR